MQQTVGNSQAKNPYDRTYEGWGESDVKEKAWELYMLSGESYIKVDFRGNFINKLTGRKKHIDDLFPEVRNCTDAQGMMIAKRKKYGAPMWGTTKRKKRVPRR